uniref:Protein tweety homolog n=1 Tax=Glossina pallidipes TaxID=7398 RepID=A0A1A9ZEK5_GLOPL
MRKSLGILASIPAGLLILSLFGLLLYLLTRCCDRKPRKPSAQRCQSCSLVIITLMTCASIGLAILNQKDKKQATTTTMTSTTTIVTVTVSINISVRISFSNSIFKLRQH